MTAAPPDATKPEDDLGLDDLLADIDSASSAPGQSPAASSVDMDFEKELEDLFSDDPAPSSGAGPASGAAPGKGPAIDPFDELLNSAASDADDPGDVLLLEDVVEESAESGEDDGLLVLGAADEIELDLPGDVGGAPGGDIDHAGLDNLIDDLGEGSKGRKPAPATDGGLDNDLDALLASDGPADGPSLDDDLDALLNDAAPAPAQAPAPSQSLDDDLDALLNDSAPAAPAPASPLDDDLDALLGGADGPAAPAAPAGGGLDDDLAALLGDAAPAAPAAEAPAPSSDDDLDALLTDLGQEAQPGPASDSGGLDDLLDDLGVAPDAAPAASASLDDDLDALLGDAALAPQAAPVAEAPAAEEEPVPDLEDLLSEAAEAPVASVSAPDDGLDDLLAGLDDVSAPAETALDNEAVDLDLAAPAFPDDGEAPAPGEDNLEALIAGLDDPALDAPAPASGDDPDVDALLAELDEADAAPPASLDSLDTLDDEPQDGELPDLSSPDSELDALLAAMEDPVEPAVPAEAEGESLTPEEAGLFTAPPTEDDELSELLAEQTLAHGEPDAPAPAMDLPDVLPAAHDMDLDAILAQGEAAPHPGASLDDAPLRLEDAAARITRLEAELKAKDEALHTLEDRLAVLESAGLAAGAGSALGAGPSPEALLGALSPDSAFVQELKRLVLEDVASRLESLVPAAAARIIREEISVLAEELDQ